MGLEPVLFRERVHRLTVYTPIEDTSRPRVASTTVTMSVYNSTGRLSEGSIVFEPSAETLYVVVQAQYLPTGSLLQFHWLKLDGDGRIQAGVSAGAVSISAGSGVWWSGIEPEQPLALGHYLMAVSVDDSALALKPFIVVEKAGSEFRDAASYEKWAGILTGYEDYEAALYAYSKALQLAPDSASSYEGRAFAFVALRRDREAMEDANKLVALNPTDAERYGSRALVRWMVGESETALEDLARALELGGPAADYFNHRALVHATLGSIGPALEDVNRALELAEGDLNILDTRGYVHLKRGQYEQAKADYEALLSGQFTISYVMLGVGIAYARLGDSGKALPLLENGLDAASLERRPDPQLADLMAMAKLALQELRLVDGGRLA